MEKLIITAAITGAELDRKSCPTLPITAEEQASAAKACVEAGASIIHLHVRDESGKPSQEPAHFKKTIDAIKKVCQPNVPIVQISTGGAVGESIERRMLPLSLRPEMASFNLGTINFGEDIFVNKFSDMRQLAKSLKANSVIPEYEIYDLGHLDNLKKLINENCISPPYHCQFVLGVPGALSGELNHLLALVSSLPPESTWAVAGIGRFELPLAVHAMVMGGHVRVGLEDNIYFQKGVLADSSAQLVQRVKRIAQEVGRDVASVSEARKQLHFQ